MNMIVAFCKNGGIGYKNKLPWHLPRELKYFKRKTTRGENNIVVMGKNTWNSLNKKPLKNRDNFILSTSMDDSEVQNYDNAFIFSDKSKLDNHLESCMNKDNSIWFIGGKSVYDLYINNPKLHKIYATRIEAYFDCDTFFPDIPKHFYIDKSSRLINENNIFYNYNIYKNHLFDDA